MSHKLKTIYQAQLMKMGISLSQAEQAAQNLTTEQFKLIAEIWEDWATILAHHEPENQNLRDIKS
jgi:hypothetical protein